MKLSRAIIQQAKPKTSHSNNSGFELKYWFVEITEEEGQETGYYSRQDRSKRESVVTVASHDYEREYLQRNRDISVTFGYREGGSTQDLRLVLH